MITLLTLMACSLTHSTQPLWTRALSNRRSQSTMPRHIRPVLVRVIAKRGSRSEGGSP